ncbi:MAG: hypothetical protein FWH20_09255, partial [Oscillospiraceae bacterium]|nr:hypothetical protein [Oscillospiraceae bacterium]
WTKAINPHSSAIFSITAEKSGEKPAGSEAVLDNFVLVEFSQPEEPEIPAEMTAVTLHIFSELGYNVLLWDIDDATETYTIFRNGEEITSVNNQNFYLDTNVSEDSIYEYYIVQTLDEITLQSNQVTVTTTAAEPHGISAREQISNLQSDIRTPIIFQETNSYQYVSRDLELITEVENGSTITWFSSAEQIISPQGTVTRPTGGFFPVTLTSVWRNGEFEIRRKHNLNVAPLNNVENEKMTWEDLVEMNDEEIRITENRNGNINRLGGNLSQSSVHSIEDAFAFIESVSDIIDISNNESELRLNNFSDNNIDFNQYYKDIRVQNAIVRVFIDVETGIVKSLMNSFAPNIDMDINPNISAEEIKQIILIEHGINVIGEPELIIRYDLTSDPNLRLAWLINEKMDGEICIDANTGEVVYRVGNPT